MSQIPTPAPLPPVTAYPVPASGSRSSWMGCAFALSFLVNLFAGLLIVFLCLGLLFYKAGAGSDATVTLPEKFHSGKRTASDKIAVVAIEGIIMEGTLGHVHKQIEQVGKDDSVKAIVLRINSPGGTITASEDLYRKIIILRDGDSDQSISARPVVASLGSVAASGGYFIAAPAQHIVAERSTMTGSIGVYASFPNVKKLAEEHGVSMNTIKAGQIKDSGSFFKDLTPVEEQVLQDTVDDAYVQFLDIVSKGRPRLTRARLLERFQVTPLVPDPKAPRKAPINPYTRYRADGGIFTALKAKELDLVDDIGTLETAIKAAAKAANLDTYRAVQYQKNKSLGELLLGVHDHTPPASVLDADRLRSLFTPRLWYLAPGYEWAGRLTPSPS